MKTPLASLGFRNCSFDKTVEFFSAEKPIFFAQTLELFRLFSKKQSKNTKPILVN